MSYELIVSGPPAKPVQSKLFSRGKTALSKGMNPQQELWLLDYAIDQWEALHPALSTWRAKMERFERLADDNYSDRTAPNRETSDARRSIFERQNNTLGLVSGKSDQIHAQAKDDIFATRPWLAATPQGIDDTKLAELITKHSQWKFDQSNLEATLIDSLILATHLGTAFPKIRWLRDIEEHEQADYVLHSKKSGKPILDPTGDYIVTDEAAAQVDTQAFPPADWVWKEILITETTEVYDNIDAANLDWKDIAFDPIAPELNLRHTDFLHRFKMGVHDLVAAYDLDTKEHEDLIAAAQLGGEDEPRAHRGESEIHGSAMALDPQANPVVWLVEGYLRCDPFNTGKPVRIHVIFSPDLRVMFRCDFLANVTPGGMLPVFAVRAFKQPRRVLGKGYWERFQEANDTIDGFFNATTLRNRRSADVLKGFKRSAFVDKLEGQDIVNDPDKVYEIADDKSIDDAFQFKVVPDANGRSDALLQQMLQTLNLRMGTSSASQGELAGIPENDTATGSKLNAGRAALLDRSQISQMMKDLQPVVEYSVHLNYANQNQDETFTWGEGRDAELLQIRAGDVKGLRANVSLSLTQSQNLQKLEAAKAAIQIATSYSAVPEIDKSSLRRLFIQAIAALGFNDAEKVIREAVLDAASISALLPPEMQPVFDAFLASQGLAAPAVMEGEGAPASDAPVMPTAAA
ncbi:hypothetical protein OKA04_12335 [Luteolibacter flavescens]|uniref:Phage portal protein n=1 Tax=Luteolibacter flavescens TaxID=1859460 RepID=A0ABT3FPM5_9BACT|nr:hypothetical protein [Luteolibacter flavescens]MCW1885519.1 hypothetical protein [Luteolibacter flavescens]